MHAISSYRGNRHTNPQTGPITIHCATASLARSVIIIARVGDKRTFASVDQQNADIRISLW